MEGLQRRGSVTGGARGREGEVMRGRDVREEEEEKEEEEPMWCYGRAVLMNRSPVLMT